MATDQLSKNPASHAHYLKREKFTHIVKAARSATLANILAPLLCIPVFRDEVRPAYFDIWLCYMAAVIALRTWVVYGVEYRAERMADPQRDLQHVTWAIGMVGLGWGLGWPLLTPDLSLFNRMIYVYMTTAAMISSMFAYSVDSRVFFVFTLTIMLPATGALLWFGNEFPWPFLVGLVAVYGVVLGIARSFSKIFEDSVRLRFRNERLYQELATERDQSIAANVAKSKFIAAASHDLRQPLHAININLDLVNPENLLPHDRGLMQKIKSSITALNSMFEALLNMSKLDSHTTKVEQEEFALSELADSVREIAQSRAFQKGLALFIEAPALTVRGDRLMLQQILLNLVFNAIQYTRTGHVRVEFTSDNNCLAFQVSDTGEGIAEQDRHNIFNEFYRAHRTRGLHEGLGLGLTIVKRLCDLIGASVQVNSNLGEGATFRVSTQDPVFSLAGQSGQTDHRPSDNGHASGLRGKCIAIIEDDDIIVDAYKQTFAALGARVVVFSEMADELQRQLQSVDRIDCILSDYRLKHTTGDVIIETLRENFNDDIPAVIVTADTSPGNIEAFNDVRATVLYKPLTFREIVQALEKMLA